MPAKALALIRRAVDMGANHFDCARCYGNSLSKLGFALKEGVIERSEVIYQRTRLSSQRSRVGKIWRGHTRLLCRANLSRRDLHTRSSRGSSDASPRRFVGRIGTAVLPARRANPWPSH